VISFAFLAKNDNNQSPTLIPRGLPYILAYKLTLKKLPQNEEFLQKLAYKLTPKIPWCVLWANNKSINMQCTDEGSLSEAFA